MDRNFGAYRFWTTPPITDCVAGSATVKLHRDDGRDSKDVAEVVYWDSEGHYYLKTVGCEIPVPVIEELIAETKELIRVR